MKAPTLLATSLAVGALLSAAGLLVVISLALPAPAEGSMLRAWNPKVFLLILTVAPITFTIAIVGRAIGRRSDASLAQSIDSDLVLPVYIYPATRTAIRTAFPELLDRHLPSRAVMAVTPAGLELWGRPSRTRYLTIPWLDVSSVRTGVVKAPRNNFHGISLDLVGADGGVEFVLVGTGLLGIPSEKQAAEAAALIRARKP